MIFTNDFLSALILAIVQGLTEWLPISSSGHLLILERLLNYDGGLVFEVALHFGTLMAVFIYFSKDITDILRDLLRGRFSTENGRLGVLLLVGTIPAAIVGFLVKNYFDTILSGIVVAGLGFMITGVLLLIVAFIPLKRNDTVTWKKSLVIGTAQAVAILPSISRSGATIASGVLLGLSEKTAMKFSFLLSIPAIMGASLVAGPASLSLDMVWGTIVSFAVGLATIHICFKYLLTRRENFKWFGIYALALGIVVLIWALV